MLTHQEIALRLLIAAALGAIVGLERERLEWVAGLRTHMLVCVGACLMMIVSAFGFADVLDSPHVVLDPSRVAAQVVSGIGFLGAGTILFLRQEVIRGLTTAASLWTIAGVGLAVGGGMYVAAVGATALVVVILAAVKPVERRLFASRRMREMSLRIDRSRLSIERLEDVLESCALTVDQISLRRESQSTEERVRLTLVRGSSRAALLDCVNRLRELDGVLAIDF